MATAERAPRTLAELRDWLAAAPVGTMLPAGAVLELLDDIAAAPSVLTRETAAPAPESWRVKLWTVPAETRLGVAEVAEAAGKPKSWVYRHTGPAAEKRIPHRKLDGELVFVAGEVRAWLRDHEHIVEAGPIYDGDGRRLRAV
ncbi:MAG TPA: hypothetical protein VFQ38_04270 [Longimicrobiales bacterium]|nr:hypothetical protein [Longimicrobiales bacterium]